MAWWHVSLSNAHAAKYALVWGQMSIDEPTPKKAIERRKCLVFRAF
jgi:hypothetical protein